ncbi:MAG: DNA translocase FtsK 4TM domain-containing protein, partial [Alphaproteobacteria bacterium]
MATRSAPTFSFQFLPPHAAAWMRLRAIETLGIACALAAGWLLLALFTYDATDPSFNHATNAAAANMAGLLGAFTSDLAFTWLGVAAYLPSLILLVWARRLIVRHALPNPAWRLVMTPVALLLLCPAMTLAAWPGAYGLPAGPGGLTGALIATSMIKVPAIADLAVGWVVLALALPGLAAFAFATALPWTDLATLGRALRAAWQWSVASIRDGLPALREAAPEMLAGLRERFARKPADVQDIHEDEDEAWYEEDEEEEEPVRAARVATPRKAAQPEKPAAKGRVKPRADTAGKTRRKAPKQTAFAFDPSEGFNLPAIDLLTEVDHSKRKQVDEGGLEQNAR